MSRLDKLKEQNPDLNVSILDIISSLDPTNTYKYVEFLIKNFKNGNIYYSSNTDEFKRYLGTLILGSKEIEILNEFEKHSRANRVKEKDISKYDSFLQLETQVKIAEEIEKRKTLEKQILKLHEDDTWLILTPLSFDASKVYGSNTKWCVTEEKYWESYLSTHRLIYCIDKKQDTKVAFSRDFRNDNFQAWDQQDKEVSPMSINFIPDELFLLIRNELQRNSTTGNLIMGGKQSKNVTISDITIMADGGTVVDRIRRLMGTDNNELVNNNNVVVRRRINDYSQINPPNLSDFIGLDNIPPTNLGGDRIAVNSGVGVPTLPSNLSDYIPQFSGDPMSLITGSDNNW